MAKGNVLPERNTGAILADSLRAMALIGGEHVAGSAPLPPPSERLRRNTHSSTGDMIPPKDFIYKRNAALNHVVTSADPQEAYIEQRLGKARSRSQVPLFV